MAFIDKVRASQRAEETAEGNRKGFYLVRASDSARFFIAENESLSALEHVGEERLGGNHGFDYWVDFLHGFDITGARHWANVDQTGRFF